MITPEALIKMYKERGESKYHVVILKGPDIIHRIFRTEFQATKWLLGNVTCVIQDIRFEEV